MTANIKSMRNIRILMMLALLTFIAVILYMTVDVRFDSRKLLQFSMKIRAPKVVAMLIVAVCICA